MDDLFAELERKDADINRITAAVGQCPTLIPELLAGLGAPKARIRYGCEKVLRRLSEGAPELLHSHFDVFAGLLDSQNSFLRWGAIQILANLVRVDREGRFDGIFERYFAPIDGPAMITAANLVGAAARIAHARPDLADRIVRTILGVEAAGYENRGAPSPECNRVVCAHALATFDTILDLVQDRRTREAVIEFARRQLASSRPQVRRKAKELLKRHGQPEGEGV